MASLGHPLLGDPVYGGNGTRFEADHRKLIHGQCLHAGELTLTHPRTGEKMHFEAPLPADLAAILEILRRLCG
jgi:23S rRNA pseudouridine1911/1915/1917 synthase